MQAVIERVEPTLLLTFYSLIVAVLLGVPAGSPPPSARTASWTVPSWAARSWASACRTSGSR